MADRARSHIGGSAAEVIGYRVTPLNRNSFVTFVTLLTF
jgi:hypothetical protein